MKVVCHFFVDLLQPPLLTSPTTAVVFPPLSLLPISLLLERSLTVLRFHFQFTQLSVPEKAKSLTHSDTVVILNENRTRAPSGGIILPPVAYTLNLPSMSSDSPPITVGAVLSTPPPDNRRSVVDGNLKNEFSLKFQQKKQKNHPDFRYSKIQVVQQLIFKSKITRKKFH